MEIKLHQFDLELQHTFTISRESIDIQPTLIVEIQEGDLSGYGEATTNPYYKVTITDLKNTLEQIRKKLAYYQLQTPEQFWTDFAPYFKDNSFALCALDMAIHDLYGRQQGKPLYELWNLNPANIPLTNYTIGIDSIPKMVEKMQEKPWELYKIKLGTDYDLDIVRELRKYTNSTFRIDANCAWDAETTIRNSQELKKLGVEFIEQPLPAHNWEEMKEVFEKSALPIIADESCIEEKDVARCFGFFHGINIKLPKCGGLTPARRMIQMAQKLDLKVMVGCMTESLVGISAIAHLSPLLDFVDMDGAMLLKNQIANGVNITSEKVIFPDINGTGVTLYKPIH